MNLSKLNDSQREAVMTTEGPLLIIAGPGSGKTSTLVERAIYLISEKKVSPERILIATFTEKAAKELITRISNRLIQMGVILDINKMYIGTIHSICLRLLNENLEFSQLDKNYRMMEAFEQKYLIYRRLDRFSSLENYLFISSKISGKWNQTEKIEGYVNKLREEMIDPCKLLNHRDERIKFLGRLLETYLEILKEENAVDFSGLQFQACKLINENSKVIEKIQEQLEYIMIDEYQDTNTVQEKIILKIAEKKKNICVVGDDDQGLYRFRGATVRNILEFENNFAFGECKKIKLSVNYRSHPDIVDIYNSWMSEFQWGAFRFLKQIVPFHKKNGSHSVMKIFGNGNDREWHEEIYNFIDSLKKSGKLEDLNQIAFLFKSVKNEAVIKLCDYLESKDIPVYSPRSGKFFERKEIKFIIGCMISLFPQYQDEMESELQEGNYSDLPQYYEDCWKYFQEAVLDDKDFQNWIMEKQNLYTEFFEDANINFSNIFYEMLQFKPFVEWLEDTCLDSVSTGRSARNIATFSKMLADFEYMEEIPKITSKNLRWCLRRFFNIYLRFLMTGGVEEYESIEEYAPSGCVSFFTIHQSKGLEFPIVFVGLPGSPPKNQYDEVDEILAEEIYSKPIFEPLDRTKEFDFQRLYYTAFSRAQNLLILTAKGRIVKDFNSICSSLKEWRNYSSSFLELELEKIKKSELKAVYSFNSHILTYENCPREYKFFRELEFSPAKKHSGMFGSLVHQTIEDIHKKFIEGTGDEITRENIMRWFDSNYESLAKLYRNFLTPKVIQSAFNQVLTYAESHKEEIGYTRGVEVELSYINKNYILTGIADLIKEKEGVYEIIDFKSTEKPENLKDSRVLEIYKRQLEMYSYLFEQNSEGKKIDKLKLYFTSAQKSNPYVEIKRESDSIKKTMETFEKIINDIQHRKFQPKRNYQHCRNCDMNHYCKNVK